MSSAPKPAPKLPRQNALAKIHIAKKDLCLDDDTYREVLQRLCGVASAKELTDRQLGRVLAEFRRLGWKPKAPKPQTVSLRLPQLRKINLLWSRLLESGAIRAVGTAGRSPLLSFVEKQTGVARLEWLSVAQAGQIIEALKAWGKRVGADIE